MPPVAEAALQEVAASAQQWPEQLQQLMDVVMGKIVPEAAVLLVEVDAAAKGTEQTLRDVSWNALTCCAFCDWGGSNTCLPRQVARLGMGTEQCLSCDLHTATVATC